MGGLITLLLVGRQNNASTLDKKISRLDGIIIRTAVNLLTASFYLLAFPDDNHKMINTVHLVSRNKARIYGIFANGFLRKTFLCRGRSVLGGQ
jgi:hypothetical protein